MFKLNNKGLTLIELLTTITILSIVLSITIFFGLNIIKNAKNKSYEVTKNNIELATVAYLKENNDITFVESNNSSENLEYQCIKVKNLIDYGYFDTEILKSEYENGKTVAKNQFVYVERNKTTKAIISSEFPKDNSYCDSIANHDKSIIITYDKSWAKSKEVKITYKLNSITDLKDVEQYKYLYDINGINQIDEKFKNNKTVSTPTFNITKNNSEIYAKIYNINDLSETHKTVIISKIDNHKPYIEELNGDENYSNTKNVLVTIKDDESAENTNDASGFDSRDKTLTVKYGWSLSNKTEPTEYKETSISYNDCNAQETTKECKTATFNAIYDDNSNGSYYLWIKPDMKDMAGNTVDGYVSKGTYKVLIESKITYRDCGDMEFSGTGAGPEKYIFGEGATLDIPTKAGYTFGGYYTSSACTGAAITSISSTEMGDKQFFAKWNPNTATVTIKKDESAWAASGMKIELRSGSTIIASSTVTSGSTVTWTTNETTTIAAGTYDLYAGANSNSKTTMKDTGENLIVSSSGTGSGIANYYTLTLNNGTGISSVSGSAIYLSNQSASISATASTGYTFSKWTVGSGNTPSSTTSANTSVTVTQKTSLEASASTSTYTISYNLNGGTNDTANPSSYTIETSTITLTKPTKTFKVNITNSASANLSTTSVSKTQTFAGWTGSNGSTLQTSVTITKGSTGNKSYTANWTPLAVTLPTVTKSGYTCGFTGTSGGTSIVYPSGGSYTPSATSGSTTLYTVCKSNTATVTIKKDGSTWSASGMKIELRSGSTMVASTTVTSGSTATFTGIPAGTYNVYAGANSNSKTTMVDSGIDLTVTTGSTTGGTGSATINYYTLTLSKGTTINTVTGSAIYLRNQAASISATANTGYSFTKWTVVSGNVPSSTASASTSVTITQKTSLRADGNDGNEYTITYKDCENATFSGTHVSGYPTIYKYGVGANLDNPTKTGYTFGGYYTSSACSGTAVTSIGTSEYGNKTYYAKWNPNTAIVTIKKDGSTWSSSGMKIELHSGSTIVASSTVSSGSTAIFTEMPAGTYDLYAGANSNSKTTMKDTGENLIVSSSGIGTATINYYTLTLNKGTGISSVSGNITYLRNQTASISAIASTGYTFSKWNVESGNTPLSTSSASTSVTVTQKTTLEASASTIAYTISYTLNGGTNNTSNSSSYNIETSTFTLKNPVKTFKVNITNSASANLSATSASKTQTFAGWTGSNGSTPQTSVTITKGSTGNKSYTANWTPVAVTLPTVTKSGYTCGFTGTSGGTSIVYPSGGSYTPSATSGSTTLYTVCKSNTATVTIKKDGSTWSASGMKIELRSGSTMVASTTVTSGSTATFTEIPAGTYNVYAGANSNSKTTMVDSGIDLTVTTGSTTGGTGSATINYYTLTLSKGTGISTVSGDAIYLSNQTAYINTTVITGYTFSEWSVISGNVPSSTASASTSVTITKKTSLYANTTIKTFFAIIYYWNGSSVTNIISSCETGETSCTVTIPTAVTGSTGKYNGTYVGLASTTNTMTASISSSSTTITLSTNKTYYAIYRKNVTVYYPTSTTSVTYTKWYRNEYLTGTSAITSKLSTSNTGTSNATTISGILGTYKGLATAVNSTSTIAISTAAAQTTTTYYGVSTTSITATFYYYNGSSVKSTYDTGTRTNYCKTTSTATTSDVYITVPSAVTGSTGTYSTTYKGLASTTGTMSTAATTAVIITSSKTYYAVYQTSVTNYYYSSSYTNRTIYRNQWLTSTSTISTPVLSTSSAGTSNYSTASGPGSSVWTGLATSATTTPGYTSVSAAASSTATKLYTIYQFNVTYAKGANVSAIGATSGSCKVTTSSTGCTVTLPSIYANTGYTSVGWNSTSGATTGTAASSSYTLSTNGTTLYANAQANSYTIAYYDCGFSQFSGTHKSGYPTSYAYGTGATLDSPTKTGYTFGGYYTSSACSGTSVSSIGTTETGYKQLFAKWNINSYTISYTLNGGTVSSANPTSYTIQTSTFTLTNPTKIFTVNIDTNNQGATIKNASGTSVTSTSATQTFSGWTGSNGSTPQTNVTIAKGSTGNRTYTANWTPKAVTLPTVTKSGYSCGYAATASGTSVYTSGGSYTPGTTASSTTLYVKCSVLNLSFSSQTLSGGTYDTSYSSSFTGASGGTGSYSYSVSSVTLNGSSISESSGTYNGLGLSGTTISGTPSKAGTYSFKIMAIDNNTEAIATATITITISKKALTVPSQSGTLTYNKESQSPIWSNYNTTYMTLGGTTSGTNAGSYSATFTLDNATNTQWSDGTTAAKTVTWTIGRYSLSNATIASVTQQEYKRSAINPTPAVTVPLPSGSTSTLTKTTDYTYSYSNNTNVGTATITVTGTGNYTGSKSTTFTIADTIKPSCSFQSWTDSKIKVDESTTIQMTCTDSGTGIPSTYLSSSAFRGDILDGVVSINGVTVSGSATSRTYTITVIGETPGAAIIRLIGGNVADGAGNTSVMAVSGTLTVEEEQLSCSIASSTSGETIGSGYYTGMTLSISSPNSGVSYSFDGTSYGSSTTKVLSSSSTGTVIYTGYVKNSSGETASCSISISQRKEYYSRKCNLTSYHYNQSYSCQGSASGSAKYTDKATCDASCTTRQSACGSSNFSCTCTIGCTCPSWGGYSWGTEAVESVACVTTLESTRITYK